MDVWGPWGGRDGQSGCAEGVLHGWERSSASRSLIVAVLTGRPAGQRRAFVEQLVQDAAEILGGGCLASFQAGTQPGLAGELFDERSADPFGALNEVALLAGSMSMPSP